MSKTSAPSSDNDSLKYHLINKYRELIARRYDDVIKNIDKTGINLGRDVAIEIKDFFLENVYPEPAQRQKLDRAFAELRNFTTQPQLIWGLLGSLPMALFQFGSQLPHAIRAGMTSLQAYTAQKPRHIHQRSQCPLCGHIRCHPAQQDHQHHERCHCPHEKQTAPLQ